MVSGISRGNQHSPQAQRKDTMKEIKFRRSGCREPTNLHKRKGRTPLLIQRAQKGHINGNNK